MIRRETVGGSEIVWEGLETVWEGHENAQKLSGKGLKVEKQSGNQKRSGRCQKTLRNGLGEAEEAERLENAA